jgi:hypothetical protein
MLTAAQLQDQRESQMFNLGTQCTANDYRKEYAKMRTTILDAIWTVDVKTKERILGALNEFQTNSDWNFDLD